MKIVSSAAGLRYRERVCLLKKQGIVFCDANVNVTAVFGRITG